MTTDCTSTPFRVSEPLSFYSVSPISRRFASTLDLVEAVIDLEPRIASAGPDATPRLLKRQELTWERAEDDLRRLAAMAADTSAVQSTETFRFGILAFLMHRVISSETPEDVAHFSAQLEDAIFNWLDADGFDLALYLRARNLTQAFASIFDLSEGDPALDDLFPVP